MGIKLFDLTTTISSDCSMNWASGVNTSTTAADGRGAESKAATSGINP